MKVFLSLCALYLRSFYNLPGKRAPGTKPGAKELLKQAGLLLIALLAVANVGFVFVMLNLALYNALAPAGMQGMIILNTAVVVTALTLILGFLTALSTYFLSDMELQLLSMPIKPRALLGAKFVAVYASEAAFSLGLMAVTMVIFGIKEAPGPLFYLWGILASLLLPLPVLALSYLVQIPLLSLARFLRNKQAILVIGGILGVVLAVGFNLYFQSGMAHQADPEWLAKNFAGPDSLIARLGQVYPPAQYAWRAMTAPASASGAAAILAMAIACLAGPALVVALMSGMYAKSLIGFNESHLKKLDAGDARSFIGRRMRSSSAFLSMVKREIRLMNREPIYLLNGPLIIVLMPVIFAVMIIVQRDAFLSDPDMAGIMALLDSGRGALVAGLLGGFLGSGTSIACTSVSRDAKALPFIKSLPVRPADYLLAKLAHALIFGAAGSAVGVGCLAYLAKLGPADIAIGFLVAFGLSSLLNMGGLWLDTASPRLRWDSPMAALKQNPNSVIAILGSMGLMGLLGYLSFTLGLGRAEVALWMGLAPLALFGLLYAAFPRFAARRLAAMET